MTSKDELDKQKVLAVWPDAREVQLHRGKWLIAHGNDPERPGYSILGPEFASTKAAWQNAAESLPAAPEQESVAGGLSHEEHRRACMFNLPAAVFGSSPKVTPVEAKEKPLEILIELVCNRCGRTVGIGGIIKEGNGCAISTSQGHKCDGVFEAKVKPLKEGTAAVAEPKPTPSDALQARVADLEDLLMFLHRQGKQDAEGDMCWSFCLHKWHRDMESALRSWRDQAVREKKWPS